MLPKGHKIAKRFVTKQARRAPVRFWSAAALCRFVCDDWHAYSGSLLDRCLFVAFRQFPLGRLELDLRWRELRKGAESLP
jgi:hypothetical protein